ncbi:reverse transcriptase domain-containing protein [Lysinibacillus sphaericus]
MQKNPFGNEELNIAWMRCRYFCFQEISKFKIDTEIEFYDEYIDTILLDTYNKLKNQEYEFNDKQIFLTPKNSGLLRRSSFIAIQDQIVSHAILNYIGKKLDSKFYYWNCANRIIKKTTNYRSQTFIPYIKQYNKFLNQTVHKIGKGNQWVCETDIVSYFDHIDHEILLSKIKRELKNEKYSYITDMLMPSFLKSGYTYNGDKESTIKGIPQGGALSYFLSNVYLNDLDHKMKDYTTYKYLRYVDDIRIMGQTKEEVEDFLLQLQAWLWELGLEINSGKTKIYKIEEDKNLEDFKQEQSEKLSKISFGNDTKTKKINKFRSIIESNKVFNSSPKEEFTELVKLRNRKVNFSISNLIKNNDPSAFPLLVEQLEDKTEKASYLLEKLYPYRFKEKKLDVVATNISFLNRPYEAFKGVTLVNLLEWNLITYEEINKYIPSKSGIIELHLINQNRVVDPLIIRTIINKIFNRLELTNPYLINSILFKLANYNKFSVKYRMLFISKLIRAQVYKNINCTHFIANALIKDKVLWREFKNSPNGEIIEFNKYLKDNNQELYEMINADDENQLIVRPSQGYNTWESFHKSLNSINDIFILLRLLIVAVSKNKQYLENPEYIQPRNIWIKYSIYNNFDIVLNPNPIKYKRLVFATPEDHLDKENIDRENKVSFIIGMIIFSTLLNSMEDVYKLYIPYLQFNPIKIWEKNRNLFKDNFCYQLVKTSPNKEVIKEVLNIIQELTKKNPKTRLKISNFNKFITNKQEKGDKKMKFFISHSTRDKGRLNIFTSLIENLGHKVIIDHENFRYGQVISDEIKRYIEESDIVIVFYSENVAEKPKWIFEEIAYSIDINKPFVCVMLDDIPLPDILKTNNEKLYFKHNEGTTTQEIEVFIHKLNGSEFEEIKTKVNINSFNPSYTFIQYLRSIESFDLSILKEKKQLEIIDALTKGPDPLSQIPVKLVNRYLKGADINASNYKEDISLLKYFDIVETIDNGDKISSIKITNNDFYKAIYEAKKNFSPYWKEYFINAIEVELLKNNG